MKNILYLILFISSSAFSQVSISLNPSGPLKAYAPVATVTNSSAAEVSLLGVSKKDTITKNTLIQTTRPYRCKIRCTLTTPTVSIPTLTIKIKVGTASVLTIMSGVGLVGGLSNIPFDVEFVIYPISATQQYVFASITQTNGTVANLTVSNSEQFASWTLDPTIDLPVDVTATFGGLTVLGNCSLNSRVFERSSY